MNSLGEGSNRGGRAAGSQQELGWEQNIVPKGAEQGDLTRGDAAILKELKDRWIQCQEWYGKSWTNNWADLKFRYGDSDNNWQWPENIRTNRDSERKPCLTINVVKQHNLQITNSQLQKKAAIRIVPTGGDATQESANV